MPHMLVVLETSAYSDTQERMRLKSIVESSQALVRSSKGGEVVAENCYLLDLNHGASALANLLRTAEVAGLKYKTSSLADRPLFASK